MSVTAKTVYTKLDARGTSFATNLSFDWRTVTLDMVKGIVEGALTIRRQAAWRKNGQVPKAEEVFVAAMCTGGRVRQISVETVTSDMAKLSKEEKLALLKQLEEEAALEAAMEDAIEDAGEEGNEE